MGQYALTELTVILLLAVFLFALPATAQVEQAAKEKQTGPLIVEPDAQAGQKVMFWLESTLKRVYLKSEPGPTQTINLLAPRNGQVSFQACVKNQRIWPLNVQCSVTGSDDLNITVRRVGYVPMRFCTTDVPISDVEGIDQVPGFVPDPLYNDQIADVGPFENTAFWITVKVPTDVKPGIRDLTVKYTFHKGTQSAELKAKIDVSSFIIKPRSNFPVTHWWRSEALWDYYKTGMYEDPRFWEITKYFIKDLVDHGTNIIYVPILHGRREDFKRPPQLLKVYETEPGKYKFDFSDVSKFLKLAKECGAQGFEWTHLWIYWGVEHPMRVYKWEDGKAVNLWAPDIDGHGEVYHNFLIQYLPELHKFLIKEGVLDKSYFHLSDEPGSGQHVENYKKARTFLREVAPWMKVIDALSDINYGRQGLTDMPIPDIANAQAYIDEKIPHWVYFCCGPRGTYLQRLLDTPLPKVRMSGWLFYKLQAKGFLHWGYNYWHAMEQEKLIDPFQTATNEAWPGIPPGDPFVVYPGADGRPVDSIRWEVFAESLQDYAILQTAGIKPDDPMLADIKTYAEFPKSAEWINKALYQILK